jgi:hypothetical protein
MTVANWSAVAYEAYYKCIFSIYFHYTYNWINWRVKNNVKGLEYSGLYFVLLSPIMYPQCPLFTFVRYTWNSLFDTVKDIRPVKFTMRNKIPSNTTNVKYIKILNYQERHVSTQLRGHHQTKIIKQVIVHKMYVCLTGSRSVYEEV